MDERSDLKHAIAGCIFFVGAFVCVLVAGFLLGGMIGLLATGLFCVIILLLAKMEPGRG